jgi:phage baseplate assembly protein W|tara:strand:+ start:59 stop:481 length:423 start_codon:yes stop_codon:yes gene_type:complete
MVALRSGAVDPRRKEIVYRDLGLSFIPHPVTKNVSVLKNEDAVKRAIRNLILTNKGEQFFDELYGGNITALLFENVSPVTVIDIKENIRTAVRAEEPRATVLDVEVISSPDLNTIKISVIFSINDSPEPSLLSFTVERVR